MAPEKVFPGKHNADGTPAWSEYYCSGCNGYVRWGPWAGAVLIWIEACDWCAERAAERQAEVEALEELWAIRECAASDCSVVFTPRRAGQRYCSDPCRWRAHRRRKKALTEGRPSS
jgi:hypothetical protein